jgi:hypothetical protein
MKIRMKKNLEIGERENGTFKYFKGITHIRIPET